VIPILLRKGVHVRKTQQRFHSQGELRGGRKQTTLIKKGQQKVFPKRTTENNVGKPAVQPKNPYLKKVLISEVKKVDVGW